MTSCAVVGVHPEVGSGVPKWGCVADAGQRALPTSGFVCTSHGSPGELLGCQRGLSMDPYQYGGGERELGVSGCFGEAGLGASSLGSDPGP